MPKTTRKKPYKWPGVLNTPITFHSASRALLRTITEKEAKEKNHRQMQKGVLALCKHYKINPHSRDLYPQLFLMLASDCVPYFYFLFAPKPQRGAPRKYSIGDQDRLIVEVSDRLNNQKDQRSVLRACIGVAKNVEPFKSRGVDGKTLKRLYNNLLSGTPDEQRQTYAEALRRFMRDGN